MQGLITANKWTEEETHHLMTPVVEGTALDHHLRDLIDIGVEEGTIDQNIAPPRRVEIVILDIIDHTGEDHLQEKSKEEANSNINLKKNKKLKENQSRLLKKRSLN